MTHLKNNGIALAVHALLAVAFYFLFISDAGIERGKIGGIAGWGILVFVLFAYIACGFFLLRPVKKNSFLSVIFVVVAVIIATICVVNYYRTWESDMGQMLYAVNPSLLLGGLMNFLPRHIGGIIGSVILLLSPVLPSLLMYLGMVLRRHFEKIKLKKSNCSTQMV